MNVFLVSFSTTAEDLGFYDLELRRERLHDSSVKIGIKKHFKWDRSQLKKTSFYKENKAVLDNTKGAGYWLWKPYIILDALGKIKEGDILIYADNSIYFLDFPAEEIQKCLDNNGFFLVQEPRYTCAQFCKRDAFHFMEQDNDAYRDAPMIQASFQIYVKKNETLAFVKEWLAYCQNKYVLTDIENSCGKPDYPGFITHKHDMSILSLLVAKYHLPSFIPLHDVMGEENARLMSDKDMQDAKQTYTGENITYAYAHTLVWDRWAINATHKLRRLMNPKKLFYILYRKCTNR